MAKHKAKDVGRRKGGGRGRPMGDRCPYCGKKTYFAKQDAKNAAKMNHPGEKGLSAYKCLRAPEGVDASKFWHYGHLNDAVRKEGADKLAFHGIRGERVVPSGREPRYSF